MSLAKSLLTLFERLHYQPTDIALFEQALTHRSFSRSNNERLEFLGDALVDLIIGEALFLRLPDVQEGELSHLRAGLVRGSTLSEVGRELGLSNLLRLGAGERKSGGAERESILAGAFEALVGAIYLDSDFATCRTVTLALFADRLALLGKGTARKDAKTVLQEWMQSRRKDLPLYEVLEVSGKAHEQFFRVACRLPSLGKVTEGSGSTRKQAEQVAAAAMLNKIGEKHVGNE